MRVDHSECVPTDSGARHTHCIQTRTRVLISAVFISACRGWLCSSGRVVINYVQWMRLVYAEHRIQLLIEPIESFARAGRSRKLATFANHRMRSPDWKEAAAAFICGESVDLQKADQHNQQW